MNRCLSILSFIYLSSTVFGQVPGTHLEDLSNRGDNPAGLYIQGEGAVFGLAFQRSLEGASANQYQYWHANYATVWRSQNQSEWFATGAVINRFGSPSSQFWYHNLGWSFSYSRELGSWGPWFHELSIGTQVSWHQLNASNRDYWFSNQYDFERQLVDHQLPHYESILLQQRSDRRYGNLAMGLTWRVRQKDDLSIISAIAIRELGPFFISNSIDDWNRPGTEWTFSGSMNYFLNSEIGMFSTLEFSRQFPFTEFNSSLGIIVLSQGQTSENWLQIGTQLRLTDHYTNFGLTSGSLYTRFQVARWTLGMSYGFSLGPLASFADRRGGLGITLAYRPRAADILHWY